MGLIDKHSLQSHPSGEATSSLVLLCIKERYCLRFDTDNTVGRLFFWHFRRNSKRYARGVPLKQWIRALVIASG